VRNSLRSKGPALKLEGGLRRRLPHTNSYQEHKNKRPVRRVGLTGRAKMKETDKEMWKTLTMERRTKSPLEIKLSMEESSNRHGEDLGAESRMRKENERRENCFWRERGHESIFEDRQTGLTSMTN
jgi:hypothetical protein